MEILKKLKKSLFGKRIRIIDVENENEQEPVKTENVELEQVKSRPVENATVEIDSNNNIFEELLKEEGYEPKPVKVKGRGKGKGNWKKGKYTLSKAGHGRYFFNYRFDDREPLTFVCMCDKEDEKELVDYIEFLIGRGYAREDIIKKMKKKFNIPPQEVARRGGNQRRKYGKSKNTGRYAVYYTRNGRFQLQYLFKDDGRLQYVCTINEEEEKEAVETIELLLAAGFSKEDVIERMKKEYNTFRAVAGMKGGKKGKKGKKSKVKGNLNKKENQKKKQKKLRKRKVGVEVLKWENEEEGKVLYYNGKRTRITTEILMTICTFHGHCTTVDDLIDLVMQEYPFLLVSAVSYICQHYNELDLPGLLKEAK